MALMEQRMEERQASHSAQTAPSPGSGRNGVAVANSNGLASDSAVTASSARFHAGVEGAVPSTNFSRHSDLAPDTDAIAASPRWLPAMTVPIGNRQVTLPACAGGVPDVTYHVTKRAGDVVCASALVLFLALPLLLVALIIWLEDRGPAFYYQTRVGKDGKTFRFYKFRSMVVNADAIKAQLARENEADGPIFKMKNDPRITRIGRFLRRSSVDELPQLINVLRGEMSIIGPRPQLPREVDLYTPIQKNRLLVQPGLFCLREVFGRSAVGFEQWIALDLLYIERRGLRTDLWILAQIMPAVVRADGAY